MWWFKEKQFYSPFPWEKGLRLLITTKAYSVWGAANCLQRAAQSPKAGECVLPPTVTTSSQFFAMEELSCC